MGRFLRLLALLAVALVLIGVIAFAALYFISGGSPLSYVQTALVRLQIGARGSELDQSVSEDDTPIRFTIQPGDVPPAIAANLAAQDLILDEALFVDYVRSSGIDRRLQAGTYFLSRSQSTIEIAESLLDPRSTQFPFRILEGWRMEEIAAAIDANPYFGFSGADFLQVVGEGASLDSDALTFAQTVGLPEAASLEGFLFPDTYTLPAQITPEGLRQILTTQFLERLGAESIANASAQNFSLFEVAALGSIVQREAVQVDEMPAIAGVYRNRLNQGMKLDADPTVQYAIGYQNGTWWPQITQANYTNVISPYNTYLGEGLPPGPIANAGLAALRAAITPEQSPYIFFRARCDGSGYHAFAQTFEEHLANGC